MRAQELRQRHLPPGLVVREPEVLEDDAADQGGADKRDMPGTSAAGKDDEDGKAGENEMDMKFPGSPAKSLELWVSPLELLWVQGQIMELVAYFDRNILTAIFAVRGSAALHGTSGPETPGAGTTTARSLTLLILMSCRY